jgi:hypothetical protein
MNQVAIEEELDVADFAPLERDLNSFVSVRKFTENSKDLPLENQLIDLY